MKKRLEWIDFLRGLAIFLVVLNHSNESLYAYNDVNYMSSISLQSRLFTVIVFIVCRFSVPFFMMISGYLLLDRDYNPERIRHFWKHNWLHLLICTEIWFVIYDVVLSVLGSQEFSFRGLLEDMLFFRHVNMSHVWYLSMIIGIYLLIPFVSTALRAIEIKYLKLPLLFFFAYAFAYPHLSAINNALGGTPFALQMNLGFSGGIYGIYLVMGYVIKKGGLKKYRSRNLAIVFVLSLAATILLQLWYFRHMYSFGIWFDCPFMFIGDAALFELASRWKHVPCYPVVNFFGTYSFAVYLIHNIFLKASQPFISGLSVMMPAKVLLLWIVSIGISFPCAVVINKIPKVGKYILLMK